ncbi:MAG: hypothetical protein U5K29_06515 [Acidimicrobiales bacterium]|nr:hypothetical protein [Acidimicrobiales bacterium]
MASEERKSVEGALIQGGGGEVYFIPNEILQNYKVEGEGADVAREAFADDEVSGFDFNRTISQTSFPSDIFQPMKAMTGPFGSLPVSAGVGDEPTDVDSSSLQYFRR